MVLAMYKSRCAEVKSTVAKISDSTETTRLRDLAISGGAKPHQHFIHPIAESQPTCAGVVESGSELESS